MAAVSCDSLMKGRRSSAARFDPSKDFKCCCLWQTKDSPSHTVMGKSSALGVRDRVPFVALLQIAPLVALERMSADDFGTFLSA